MKIFNCDNCGHPVFFENVQCLNCGCRLAFLPDQLTIGALKPVDGGEDGLYERVGGTQDSQGHAPRYRMCHNHNEYLACNFSVEEDDPEALCMSCRQTKLLPDLDSPINRQRWYRIEVAKRRLFYTLARLGLAATTTHGGSLRAPAPTYQFLEDLPGKPPVMTGHDQGLITLNVIEADDDERVKRRVELHEPYRTLLGHLRHESGHYYWDRLIREQNNTQSFREVFGDESFDYQEALKLHYARQHGDEWQQDFVSVYATAHPWEDWAETWAHYLHMVDLLETAAAYHTSVVVPGSAPLPEDGVTSPFKSSEVDFDDLVKQWIPVTLMLNSLNRSLGQDDAYPFALSEGALRKLRYVHDIIHVSADMPFTDDGDADIARENALSSNASVEEQVEAGQDTIRQGDQRIGTNQADEIAQP
jgi:hypothetical protein